MVEPITPNDSPFFPADHVAGTLEFSKALNRLGQNMIVREDEPDDVGAAFQKFAVVTKELANLMKNMVSSKQTQLNMLIYFE